MRDYDGYGDYGDDHIRLYAPVLQRVIILTTVIVAVPVVMWTVTTFVRGYIGRPKVPVIAHAAAPQTPAQPPLSAQAPLDTSAAAGQPGDAAAAVPNTTPNNRSVATETALAAQPASGSPPPAIQTNAPAPEAAVPVDAGATAVSTDANPISAPAATSSVPPNGAAVSPPPSSAIPTRASDSTVVAAAPSGADRGLAWPNPSSISPPNFGTAPAGSAAATPAPAAMPAPRSAAAEIMPAGEPIHGPVPLPRHRPGIFAMVGSPSVGLAASSAAASPASAPASGRAPMPRVRPSEAPAESPIFSAPSGYEPGLREY
jgi:hypothetical protein